MTQRSVRTPRRTTASQPAARRQARFGLRLPSGTRFPWRAVSGGLVAVIAAALVAIFAAPVFYVSRAEIGGVRHVPAEEIYTLSGIAGQHVLWLDPAEIAAQVEASPSIESASVVIRWPARVVILVREREPAIVWEQGGARYWVDGRGNLMVLRGDIPSLVRVINEGESIPFRCPGPECTDEGAVTIDPAVVLGTQHLKTLRNNIDVLYYEPARGLSYQDGRGWRGYFGVGADMDLKLVIYEQIVATLLERGQQPVYIDVSNPDAPYYRVSQ
jgi:cell division septal protein FtsQ